LWAPADKRVYRLLTPGAGRAVNINLHGAKRRASAARLPGLRPWQYTRQGDLGHSVETTGVSMNKDQVKGATKDAAGKVQEAAGKLVNSKEQQAKGISKQVEGSVQKNYGDAKEDVKDAADDLQNTTRRTPRP